jgi:hypothetical protein
MAITKDKTSKLRKAPQIWEEFLRKEIKLSKEKIKKAA